MVDTITVFSIAGAIIAIGFVAKMLFKKTGVSDAIFLIIIGIVLGPMLGVFVEENLIPVTPFFVPLALMIILFEGGLNMEIYKVISQSFRATVLSVVYVLMATAFGLIFGYFVLGLEWLGALILGPMTAGTSSMVILPLMSKLNVKTKVKVTLDLEATITDVLNIVLVITFLQMFLGGSMNLQQTASAIVAKFSVGTVLGIIVGIAWLKMLAITEKHEYTYMLTMAALILSYVGSEILNGSGFITALSFGLILGNHKELNKISGWKTDTSYMRKIEKTLKHFQGEIAFLIRAFFFVFLGLVYAYDWPRVLYAGAIVAINLVFRYVAAAISTFKSDMCKYRRFMTLMCGTGLANATLSIMVYDALMALTIPVPYAHLYPLIVTNIIVINNVITALVPVLVRKRILIDSDRRRGRDHAGVTIGAQKVLNR